MLSELSFSDHHRLSSGYFKDANTAFSRSTPLFVILDAVKNLVLLAGVALFYREIVSEERGYLGAVGRDSSLRPE
jgi:hypothetical protein